MKLSIKKICILAVLAAAAAILKNQTIYLTPANKLILHNIPIFIVSIVFNPIYGIITVFIADIASIITTPNWNPIWILPQLFWGVIPGLFFLKTKKITLTKLIVAEYLTYSLVSLSNSLLFWLTTDFITAVNRLPGSMLILLIKAPIDIVLYHNLFVKFFNERIIYLQNYLD